MPRLFGDKLRYSRRQRGKNQVELAQHLGLASQGYIADLELGKELPSLDLIIRVARLFAIKADWLLRDTLPIEGLEEHLLPSTSESELSSQHFGARLRTL